MSSIYIFASSWKTKIRNWLVPPYNNKKRRNSIKIIPTYQAEKILIMHLKDQMWATALQSSKKLSHFFSVVF